MFKYSMEELLELLRKKPDYKIDTFIFNSYNKYFDSESESESYPKQKKVIKKKPNKQRKTKGKSNPINGITINDNKVDYIVPGFKLENSYYPNNNPNLLVL